MPIGGGTAKQLSDRVTEFGAFSPDGQQVAMLTFQGSGVNFKAAIDIIPAQGGLPVKSFPPAQAMSNLFQYSGDGQALYYPITQKGVSNIVTQAIGGRVITPMTNFNDLTIYDYDYDWKNKKLAVARGHSNTDVVLLTQEQTQ
jgi:hypothetical protein